MTNERGGSSDLSVIGLVNALFSLRIYANFTFIVQKMMHIKFIKDAIFKMTFSRLGLPLVLSSALLTQTGIRSSFQYISLSFLKIQAQASFHLMPTAF